MAKLPSEEDLGAAPSFHSGRPVASVDLEGVARGVAGLGQGLTSLGLTLRKDEDEKDRYEIARARSNFQVGKLRAESGLKDDADYETMPERHGQTIEQLRVFNRDTITSERGRQRYDSLVGPIAATSVIGAENEAWKRKAGAHIADGEQTLANILDSAPRMQTEPERAAALQDAHDMIDGLQNRGFIDPVRAGQLKRQFGEKYSLAAIGSLPAEDRLNLLREKPTDKEGFLDRTTIVEAGVRDPTNAKATTSSALGPYQFIEGTWLGMIRKYRPDLASRPQAELLDMRRDKTLSREMAGHLYDENKAALEKSGLEASAGNLYLAHFLGPNDAVAVLKADPTAPVADFVAEKSVQANRSVLAGKTAGTVIRWAENKMGGVAPGQRTMFDFISEPNRVAIRRQAEREIDTIEKTAQAADALEQYSVKNLMTDHYTSIAATGEGVKELTPERVLAAAGPTGLRQHEESVENAQRYFDATKNLPMMNEEQIQARLKEFEPKGGAKGFADQQKLYEGLQKNVDNVRKLRLEAPADSVQTDPTVQLAASKVNPQDPTTKKALFDAIMAAQGRVGIDEDIQTPITRNEALLLARPLLRALPGQERDALRSMAEKAQTDYGEHWEAAMTYALRVQRIDKEVAKQATSVIRLLNKDTTPTPENLRAVDTARDIANAKWVESHQRAGPGTAIGPAARGTGILGDLSGGFQERAPAEQRTMLAEAQHDPGLFKKTPPNKAIQALIKNPELAGDFDEEYGHRPGAAAAILQQYSKGQPKKPKT